MKVGLKESCRYQLRVGLTPVEFGAEMVEFSLTLLESAALRLGPAG